MARAAGLGGSPSAGEPLKIGSDSEPTPGRRVLYRRKARALGAYLAEARDTAPDGLDGLARFVLSLELGGPRRSDIGRQDPVAEALYLLAGRLVELCDARRDEEVGR